MFELLFEFHISNISHHSGTKIQVVVLKVKVQSHITTIGEFQRREIKELVFQ